MIIALDYDGTYTADPQLWEGFIGLARQLGHQVVVATMRYKHEATYVRSRLQSQMGCTVICTSRKAKGSYLESLGINPDIWIDDNPEWILNDAR